MADKVIKSNAVFTGLGEEPFAGGIAIEGNKIAAVCPGDEIDKYVGEGTEVFEYGDNLIMPGLVDAHNHLWWGACADSPYMVNLAETKTKEEALKLIKEFASANPELPRVCGFGWMLGQWGETAEFPVKEDLDAVVPDRPAYMLNGDCHSAWLNSMGIEEAGYRADIIIDGGSIGIGADGTPNGQVFEPAALEYAWNKVYDYTPEQVRNIIGGFMKGLAQQGVTCISEMSADDYVDLYHNRYKSFKMLDEEGVLTTRIHVYTRLFGLTDFSEAKEWQKEFCSPRFALKGLKGFVDGVTSTRTAALLEPYSDMPETCGIAAPLITQYDLNACVIAGNKAGLPARLHCIGDKAVRMALDAFEESIKVNGRHGLPNSVEHIESIHPNDIPRFKELDVIASLQGEHLPQENNDKLARIGEERCRYEWPFRSLMDAGADMAFGTDFPVVNYNQFPGIYASIARRNYDGSIAGLDNGEKLTLAEALSTNTLGSAKAYGRQDELGSLEAGKLADIIVLDSNLFAEPEEAIKDAKVVLTIMDGNVTYKA